MTITSFWGTLATTPTGWTKPDWEAVKIEDLAPETAKKSFLSWPVEDQLAYLRQHGQGDSKSLSFEFPSGSLTALITQHEDADGNLADQVGLVLQGSYSTFPGLDLGQRRAASLGELTVQPGDLEPATFLEWDQASQEEYLVRHGGEVTLKQVAGQPLIHAIKPSGGQMTVFLTLRSGENFEPIPYHHLSGSAAGSPSAIVNASAEALFPKLDGELILLDPDARPAFFDTAPDTLSEAEKDQLYKEFGSWHSAYQLEYTKRYGVLKGSPPETSKVLTLERSAGEGQPGNTMHIVISLSDPTRHYVVQDLDKTALGQMSLRDQSFLISLASDADQILGGQIKTLMATLGLQLGGTGSDYQIDLYQGPAEAPGSEPDGFDFDIGNLSDPDLQTDDGLATASDFIAKFRSWPPYYQAAFVENAMTDLHGTLDTSKALVIPTQAIISDTGVQIPAGAILTVMFSQSHPGKIQVVSADRAILSQEQIALMSLPDQAHLNKLIGEYDLGDLGLTIPAASRKYPEISAAIEELERKINNSGLPLEDKKVFFDQLMVFQNRIDTYPFLAASEVGNQIKALGTRLDRAAAFFGAVEPTPKDAKPKQGASARTLYDNVITRDGDIGGIKRAYDLFMEQERRIAQIAEERRNLVSGNGTGGSRMDVPYLIYRLQSLYNLSLEALIVIETEEINQQNELLKTYAKIQDAINLSAGRKEKDGTIGIANQGGQSYNSLGEYTHVINMFNDRGVEKQPHPLETLYGISRPLIYLFNDQGDLPDYDKQTWGTQGTRISETVTLFNQQNQMKMNDVSSMDKQRNRHFELANGALSKMNEIIQSIGRIG